MSELTFSDVLDKYSQFLSQPDDKKELLRLGVRLFGVESSDQASRVSYSLLKAKEAELGSIKEHSEVKIKSLAKAAHVRSEQAAPLNAEQIPEEIMVIQDRNGVLLSRRKALEKQRDEMNSKYGKLMESSVQTKVHLKLQMQKLKAELHEALTRSRPSNMADENAKNKTPIMEELISLNNQVLNRIGSFKMALSRDRSASEKAVLSRYKPTMEKLLGQIYSHSEYLPTSEVNERFNEASYTIEHEIRDIETELKNEHERNDQLQKEAKQLGEQVAEQQEEVNRLKKQNSILAKEISYLKQISESEYNSLKESYKSLLEMNSDEGATPSSARAMVITTGNERKTIKRSPSQNLKPNRSSAIPYVLSIEQFVEQEKSMLLEMINHAQMQ